MRLKFDVIAPGKHPFFWLKRSKLLLVFVLTVFPLNLLVLPLVPKLIALYIGYLDLALCLLFIIGIILSFYKHACYRNYAVTGTLLLEENRISMETGALKKSWIPAGHAIVFVYDYVRGRTLSAYGDQHEGFNRLFIDGEQILFLIRSEEQLPGLKRLFRAWYRNQNNFAEFLQGPEQNRLIELSADFEWSRLLEIKAHSTVKYPEESR